MLSLLPKRYCPLPAANPSLSFVSKTILRQFCVFAMSSHAIAWFMIPAVSVVLSAHPSRCQEVLDNDFSHQRDSVRVSGNFFDNIQPLLRFTRVNF